MRKRSARDVLRENLFPLVLAGFLLLTGLFLPWIPHLVHTTQPEELTERTIIVEKLKYIRHRKSGYFYRLWATDGTIYNLTGDYDVAEVKAILQPNTVAEIRYHENGPFGRKYAEVVEVGGIPVVRYDNDEKQNLWPLYLIAAGSVLMGFICFAPVLWEIKVNQKRQRERDRRIAKKHKGKSSGATL